MQDSSMNETMEKIIVLPMEGDSRAKYFIIAA